MFLLYHRMIHYFNPGHESAILSNSPFYTPPENVLKMQQDLAFLPAWYAKPGDMVWVEEVLNDADFDLLQKHFPHLPKTINSSGLHLHEQQEISCWGISPQAIYHFDKMNKELGLNLILPKWHDEYRELTSRKYAHHCLEVLIAKSPEISPQLLPQFCYSIEEVKQIVKQSDNLLIVKAPFSSSGRGLLWLVKGLGNKEQDVLRGILKRQPFVTVEKALDKTTDFSMQFFTDGKGKAFFEGYSLFRTNERGAYQESILTSQQEILDFLTQDIDIELIEQIKEQLLDFLCRHYSSLYKGYISIDMMLYKENDIHKIHPCVEINMRHSMGYLALQLQKNYLSSSSSGIFKIDFSPEEGKIYRNHIKRTEQYPLQFENGKIIQGYLALCPVNSQSKYCAFLYICRHKVDDKRQFDI